MPKNNIKLDGPDDFFERIEGFDLDISGKGIKKSPVMILGLELIRADPNQPRRTFNEEKLKQLAESIKKKGVLQPILVRPNGEGYIIIAGERRFRASSMAGLLTVPCIIRECDDAEAFQISLIENILRDDLNPLEEAEGYKRLNENYGMIHEEIAAISGKSRPHITNIIRLNNLPGPVKELCISGSVEKTHMMELSSIESPDIMMEVLHKTIKDDLSVKQMRALIKKMTFPNIGRPHDPPHVKFLKKTTNYMKAIDDFTPIDMNELDDKIRDNIRKKIQELIETTSGILERMLAANKSGVGEGA